MPKTNLIFALALLLAAVSCREYDVLPDVEIAQDVWDADSVLEMLQQPEKEVVVATGATSTAKCNWQCYLNRYPDLQRAFGKHNTKAAAAHWKAHGKKEGRKCTCRARSGWKYCAGENKQCSFRGKAVVKFGAKGKWSRRTKVNGTRCANNVFGDPIPGTVKKCYYKRIHMKKLAGRPCIYGSSNMWCSVAKSCVKASGVIHYAQQGRHCVPFCLTNRFKNAKWKHC
jgi:hypothetical protein